VKRAWEIIDSITDLVVAENPRAVAETVLSAAAATLDARRSAIFIREQERMVLLASRSVDQEVLNVVEQVWRMHASELQEGRPYIVTASEHESLPREIQTALADVAALAILPIKAGERIAGLFYLDGPHVSSLQVLSDATRLARVASVAVKLPVSAEQPGMLDAYLERTSPKDVAREQLLVLLDRHEWNLSRVARVLGITRRTIYLRLDRYGIERRHASKAPRRREAL
jgi:transcriptional regulator with GAF, ATPase, and Fis domain